MNTKYQAEAGATPPAPVRSVGRLWPERVTCLRLHIYVPERFMRLLGQRAMPTRIARQGSL